MVQSAREHAPDLVALRHQHSAVESAINALEVNGLDCCLDHGIDGFKRYITLAVVARNIQPRKSNCTTKTQRTQRISMRCAGIVDHRPGDPDQESNLLFFFVIFVPWWCELPNWA